MSTLSKAELEKANGQIAHLKSLIKVHKCDNQYAVERHGMDKQKFIHNSRYRHLKRADLEKKLEKWVLKKAQHRKNRIQITFYNKEEEEEEDSNPSKYSMDQVQQLILYCFAANREEITFATISNLRQVERVCVYVLEDQKLDQHFKNDFKSRFDHVLNYECPDNWFYSLHQISIKKRQVIVKDQEKDEHKENEEKGNRMSLLLSLDQMIKNNYPLPVLDHDLYVCTNSKYEPVHKSSPMFAVDCEMCLAQDQRHQLARISVVDEDLNVLLDEYIKPKEPVINYLTEYSGITKRLLDNASWTLEQVQNWFKNELPADCILVGHSLNSDLHAMKLCHPYVIDTSIVFNLSGMRSIKPSLKQLSWHFLKQEIQNSVSRKGHCSIEDARATMQLIRLKLNRGIEYGDECMAQRSKSIQSVKEIRLGEHLQSHLNEQIVFHDYPQAHQLKKFVSCYSKYTSNLNNSIAISLTQKQTICAVICKDKVYLHMTS